jgi:leucyl-tRNA synthetase
LWIRKAEGALIEFPIEGKDFCIEVFASSPELIMGVSCIILAPEHPLVTKLTVPWKREAVIAYQESTSRKGDLERTEIGDEVAKTGVFVGSYVLHPISKQKIPIWISDYVLVNSGKGAIMVIPAHNKLDFIFSKQFDLPIQSVISSVAASVEHDPSPLFLPYCYDNNSNDIIVNSDFLNGLKISEAKTKILQVMEEKKFGKPFISFFNNREWNFSRQRYWGEPIPIYYPVEILPNERNLSSPLDDAPHRILYDSPIPLEESELPLKLPDLDDFHPKGDPQGCLAKAKEWRYFQKSGKWYARETNTMPQVFF